MEIIRAIVENPSGVFVEEQNDDMGILLIVTVDKEDMGKLIGRMGVMTNALRTILRSVGTKHGNRVSMRVNEPVEYESDRDILE